VTKPREILRNAKALLRRIPEWGVKSLHSWDSLALMESRGRREGRESLSAGKGSEVEGHVSPREKLRTSNAIDAGRCIEDYALKIYILIPKRHGSIRGAKQKRNFGEFYRKKYFEIINISLG